MMHGLTNLKIRYLLFREWCDSVGGGSLERCLFLYFQTLGCLVPQETRVDLILCSLATKGYYCKC
jgi:hypothetical protein